MGANLFYAARLIEEKCTTKPVDFTEDSNHQLPPDSVKKDFQKSS